MGKVWSRGKLTVFLIILEVVFLILFGLFVEYGDEANAKAPQNSLDLNKGGADPGHNELAALYPSFQDVHVMMFIGFGFLMMFLKRYTFGAVGFNLLIAAFVLQWATLIGGFLESEDPTHIKVNIMTLLTSDFTAAAILISFGACLGKLSPVQLIVMALLEVVVFKVNEWIGLHFFHAVDVGGSMFVHVFGAYFGILVARITYKPEVHKASEKEGSVYHSDGFAMVGTIFLWLFWPSFNSALAPGDDQQRAVINTYYALASCTVMTFALSSVVDKHNKLDMVHIQNSTLAGGVAVGTMADMMIEPWGAMVIGCVAAVVSVLGYKYFSPCLSDRIKFHDTCGVNNLHGMPGVIAGLGGIVASAIASEEKYGYSLYEIFPARAPVENSTKFEEVIKEFSIEPGLGWTGGQQAGMQAASLFMTLGVAMVSGALVGAILRIPIFDSPDEDQIFDDTDYWELPEEGFPGTEAIEIAGHMGYNEQGVFQVDMEKKVESGRL